MQCKCKHNVNVSVILHRLGNNDKKKTCSVQTQPFFSFLFPDYSTNPQLVESRHVKPVGMEGQQYFL